LPEAPVTPVSKPGDLWQLGNHRLLCGDSTILANVERVLEGALADMVFTDPPYNVDYGNTAKDKLRGTNRTILNDNLGDGFEQFLYDSCVNMLTVCKGAVYICMSSSELHTLQKSFIAAGGKWSTFVIWAKNTFTLGRSDYQRQPAPCGTAIPVSPVPDLPCCRDRLPVEEPFPQAPASATRSGDPCGSCFPAGGRILFSRPSPSLWARMKRRSRLCGAPTSSAVNNPALTR